jgi:hypothetical protein
LARDRIFFFFHANSPLYHFQLFLSLVHFSLVYFIFLVDFLLCAKYAPIRDGGTDVQVHRLV